MEKVLVNKEDAIAYVTVNRPEVLNCFDFQTLIELEEAVEKLKEDKSIRAVIFTGAGNKAFSVGADLKERKKLTEEEVIRNVMKISELFTKIEELPKPTIAAINGYAFGGGLEMALACDLRYASKNAMLGLTETSLAIIPGGGGTQRLSRLIGPAKAKELIFTARKLNGQEALEYGIIHKLVDQDQLMESVRSLANEIARNGPLAVSQAKYAINHGMNTDIKTGLAIELTAYKTLIPTKDRVEALKAFQEKRTPSFIGE